MKKVLLLLAIVSLGGMSVQSATINPEYSISIKKKPKDRHRHHDDRYYDRNSEYNKGIRKEKIREIEYRLDVLEAKYDRNKDRLDNSNMDKYDKKVREKELKYQYNREKDRLKDEKKRIKKGSFYAN